MSTLNVLWKINIILYYTYIYIYIYIYINIYIKINYKPKARCA